MKGLVKKVLDGLGVQDPLLEVALELEKIAIEDEYFTARKLYPNVDYYSGIMLRAIGIPTSMFTVMFAMSRTVGWVTQWQEMIAEGQMRIGRPRQLYVGVEAREYKKKTGTPGPASPTGSVLSRQLSFSQQVAKQEEAAGKVLVDGGKYTGRKVSSFRMRLPDVSFMTSKPNS
jgi:hypothetical protein